AVRYRLAMMERRVRQQGIEQALGVLHRRVGKFLQRTDEAGFRMRDMLRASIAARARRLGELDARLRRFDMRPRIAADRRRLETAERAAVDTLRARLARRRANLDQASAKLEQLSPLKILARGYAIVSNEHGIVKASSDAPVGSPIRVRLGKGALAARVEDRDS